MTNRMKNNILAILVAVLMVFAIMPFFELPAYAADSHDGWTKVSSVHNMYNGFDTNYYYVEPGNYYLNADLKLDRTLAINEGEVTICLHGASIEAPADKSLNMTIEVFNGATLNITDCGSGEGSIVNNYSNCYAAIWNEGTLNISGGNIGSNKQGIYSENGAINISRGKVSCGTCALKISGGSARISGTADIHGPSNGIEAEYAKVEIENGTVYSAQYESAGIQLTSAQATIIGGEITGVKYGVNATANSTVSFSGGTISTLDPSQAGLYLRDSKLEIKKSGYSMPILCGSIDDAASNINITCGYFSISPGAYITDAYKVVDSGYTQFPYEVVERAKAITPTIILSPTSYVYDGKVKTPAVTVKDGSTVLEKGTDYTVTYASGRKNAGNYKVTVTLKYNFKGSGSASFTIKKAANPLNMKAKTATVKLAKLKKKNQTLAVGKVITFKNKGEGKMTYKLVSAKKGKKNFKKKFAVNKKTGKVTVKKGLKKGKYKVKINVTATGNGNYNKVIKPVTVTIKLK